MQATIPSSITRVLGVLPQALFHALMMAVLSSRSLTPFSRISPRSRIGRCTHHPRRCVASAAHIFCACTVKTWRVSRRAGRACSSTLTGTTATHERSHCRRLLRRCAPIWASSQNPFQRPHSTRSNPGSARVRGCVVKRPRWLTSAASARCGTQPRTAGPLRSDPVLRGPMGIVSNHRWDSARRISATWLTSAGTRTYHAGSRFPSPRPNQLP